MDDATNFQAVQVQPLALGQGIPVVLPSPPPDPCPLFSVQDAMRIIGFSEAEVTQLLEVTAVVLKLGDLQLSSQFQASGMEACGIQNMQGWAGRHPRIRAPVCIPHPGEALYGARSSCPPT